MAVISGIGVRQYYRKLGYKRQGTYLIKKLALNRTVLYASGPVIIRRKRVALIRDANDPFWKFPGGGVKSGETWVETAQRECREEIGLSASLYGEPVILRICQPKRFIVLIHYLASVKSPRFKPGADIIAARWFPINHLPQRCAPNIKPSLERLIQNNVKFTCASKRKA
jgi:ADP-ribose pyrophosphatase YjhB (NUDIX family)